MIGMAPWPVFGCGRGPAARRSVPGRRLAAVKRVLLTGMSGTGKSSVIRELAALGYKAVDTDDGWCEPLPDGRQRWREDAIAGLLDTADADVLFIAGCEENQARFRSRFDVIILLSAPAQVMTKRLAARTGNSYGKARGDMDRILADLAAVEPLLRKAADHEISTTLPLADVVAKVLHLAATSQGDRCTRAALEGEHGPDQQDQQPRK
jgi:dephospho-CoA kinase